MFNLDGFIGFTAHYRDSLPNALLGLKFIYIFLYTLGIPVRERIVKYAPATWRGIGNGGEVLQLPVLMVM